MKLAVAGPTGFIGRATCLEARARGVDVLTLTGWRLPIPGATDDPFNAVRNWVTTHAGGFARLVERLEGADVLVNATGLAKPESNDFEALNLGNAVMPAVLAEAASVAGVRRMVHVSSAAVQGRRYTLDETTATQPVTAYGRSKALAEAILLEGLVTTPPEVIVYRGTSVQGADRSMTKGLVKLCSLPVLPLAGGGDDVPVPVALIENAAGAIVRLSCMSACPAIALHPWEGMTARSLLTAFGAARLLPVPRPIARAGLVGMYAVGRASSRAAAVARRLDLIVMGQRQDARALADDGFVLPAGPGAYVDLAHRVRVGQAAQARHSL